ncbi:DUF1349 domain-containing protein [Xenorhabdus sp. XENO-10]|uniref:DUF1349 domain-containing protein n=1 Tax=Xenorhabdus yunnanensis TaxID=3025878 RepID=A0ABT5LE31_9GAMM|nr:DUF1349 domain-containing protein [Xenorhabdus yunnanensis]MDC9588813.1 DUF1349 domain-containing protein [Xenorhabdus yunnanensis]
MLKHVFTKRPKNSTVKWLNPPLYWETDMGLCRIKPASGTDFWRETYFGHTADNGHALLASFCSSIVISTDVIFSPQHDYDQAGLMIRLSDKNWIKFSVELEPDRTIKLGTTVTSQGISDWSGEVIATTDTSIPNKAWAGIYAACPRESGFIANFEKTSMRAIK